MTIDALTDVGGHPDRVVALEAVHNFRDLGGYPTSDGRTTRWRTLYRADGLHRLAGADLDVVRTLGLRTVVDLRRPDEIAERGTFPVADHPVEYHNLSVLDVMWHDKEAPPFDDDADFLHWAYSDMLASGGATFADALGVLAGPGAFPAVFHCAAGKDRTGLLAMLVLGALGVPHDYIVADYALTAARMIHARAWYAAHFPEQAALGAEVPSAFLAALPAAMARVVDDLCATHGSVRAYLGGLGVSPATLDRLADGLLEEAAM
jgi:protein-tyrosine phosphatase